MHRANQLSHSQLQRAARLAVSWPGPVLGRVGRGRVARGCVFQARLATRPGRCTRAKPVVATRTSAHWDCVLRCVPICALWPMRVRGPGGSGGGARGRGDRPIRDRGGHVYQNEFGIADMNHCDGTMHQCSVDNERKSNVPKGFPDRDPRLIGVSTLRLHAMRRPQGAQRCATVQRKRPRTRTSRGTSRPPAACCHRLALPRPAAAARR